MFAVLTPDDAENFILLVCISIAVGTIFSTYFYCVVPDTGGRVHKQEQDNSTIHVSLSPSIVEHKEQAVSWTHWFTLPSFYFLGIMYMSCRLIVNLSQMYLPLYLLDTLKMNKTSISLGPLAFYLCSFLSTATVGRVAVKLGLNGAFLTGITMSLGGCAIFQVIEPEHSTWVYAGCFCAGVGGAAALVVVMVMQADFIGQNTEGGAFVYGVFSFVDKLSGGIAVIIIQKLTPECPVGSLAGDCAVLDDFYRNTLAAVPACCAVLAMLALTMHWIYTKRCPADKVIFPPDFDDQSHCLVHERHERPTRRFHAESWPGLGQFGPGVGPDGLLLGYYDACAGI